jgi:flagellar hook-associated protein 1 FlgK
MSSDLGGVMDSVRRAFATQQQSLSIISKNISSATVDGYSRLSVQVSPTTGENITLRTRDALLDRSVRLQNGPAAHSKQRAETLGRIESVFGEPSDNGLAAAMDGFWGAWGDLANTPTDSVTKTAVQQKGIALTSTFNRYAAQLTNVDDICRSAVLDGVSKVNELCRQIGNINGQLGGVAPNDGDSSALLDTRDRLIDQLSMLVQTTVNTAPDGTVSLYVASDELVRGPHVSPMSVQNGPPLAVSVMGANFGGPDLGGQIGGMLQALNTDIPAARNGLDALAKALVQDVNAVHTAGWSPATQGTGVPFFSTAPEGMLAAKISLSELVANDASAIVTGTLPNAQGDNSAALSLAALRDRSPSAAGGSFGSMYQSLVTQTASTKNAVDADATVYGTLADQAASRRQSAIGVNTDEELVKMMGFQQSYAAAAKVSAALDQMIQTLLNSKN